MRRSHWLTNSLEVNPPQGFALKIEEVSVSAGKGEAVVVEKLQGGKRKKGLKASQP